MTDAYILGFCKTAEAYGVDPQELVKVADGLVRGDPILRMVHDAKRLPNLTPEMKAQILGLQKGRLYGLADAKTSHLYDELFSLPKEQKTPEMFKRVSEKANAPIRRITKVDDSIRTAFKGNRRLLGAVVSGSHVGQGVTSANSGLLSVLKQVNPQARKILKSILR